MLEIKIKIMSVKFGQVKYILLIIFILMQLNFGWDSYKDYIKRLNFQVFGLIWTNHPIFEEMSLVNKHLEFNKIKELIKWLSMLTWSIILKLMNRHSIIEKFTLILGIYQL